MSCGNLQLAGATLHLKVILTLDRLKGVLMEVIEVSKVFPKPITKLPQADMPFDGLWAYLSQSDDHQIIFMEFTKDTTVPEHSHEAQWAVVVEGRIDLVIGGKAETLGKGDQYFIPSGVKHSAKVYEGYADVTFFNQKDRYNKK
jgi:quercetin dioxygenase-like cupin family protein